MTEYPKALYRKGAAFQWEGLSLDLLTVDDAVGEREARGDGWQEAADLFAPEKPDHPAARPVKRARK